MSGDKSEDVISAVKALENAVKGLEMAPVVNVAPTPIDLTGIEKKIAEIPGKIKIPQTVIPEASEPVTFTVYAEAVSVANV